MNSDLERNVACCDDKIESLEARIDNAKASGEDVDELKDNIKGYKKTRKELLEGASVPDEALDDEALDEG